MSLMVAFRTRKDTIALAAVCLASLMFGLEISSVPTILPTLEKVLHASFKQMQWIMNAYTIACTTVLMATGTLADRFGRRRLLIISITLFGITSLICGMAQSAFILIVGRFLQGISGGAMLISHIAVLSHQFRDGQERSKAFGWWGIIFGIGLGFGPIIGGMIVAVSNWQWVFLVHVLIAVLTLALVFSGVQESNDPQAKELDVLGIVTLSLSIFGLTYFITQGPDFGWASISAVSILAGSAISFLIFLCAEMTNAHPMFDFSVFRIHAFSGAIFGAIGMNFSFWPFMIYLPIYFQSGLGYGSVMAGLSLLAYTLPTLVIPPLAERLVFRYQPGFVIPTGLFVIGLGFLTMRYGIGASHASWLTIFPGSLLAGVGLGLTNTPVTNTTTGSVSSSCAGMASGIDMSARLITLAINIALMGFILVEGIVSSLRTAFPRAFHTSQLHSLAEMIAVGNAASLRQASPELFSVGSSGAFVHAALVQGFSSVMLYAAIGVWVLAAMSFLMFSARKACPDKTGTTVGDALECSAMGRVD